MNSISSSISAEPVVYFDDVVAGETYTSTARTVTEADVVNFAGLSGDFHPLHMDASYAAAAPFGQRIAHGMLVVSMSAGLVVKLPLMRALETTTLALVGMECRFLQPTFIGDTIHAVIEVVGKTESRKSDRGRVELRRSIVNQNGQVVIEGVWTLLLRRRPT